MSKIVDAARWFKQTFGKKAESAVAGTPFSVDLITAIAIQETFEIWGRIYKTLPPDEVLELCVGDVIGEPKRKAFPKTKAALLAAAKGADMFKIAHDSLVAMAAHATEYEKYAKNPDRFCHAFGIFQYDIQKFAEHPEFFLERQWRDIDKCLEHCVDELTSALKSAFGAGKESLSDLESVYVAIAYNKGSVNTKKGLKQGFKDSSGKYYGEYVNDYLQAAHQAI